MRRIKDLTTRRYEHRNKYVETPEFIHLIHQAAAKEEYTEKLSSLFSAVRIENTSSASKKKATVYVQIARNNGNIFVSHAKKPVVEGYINPLTELLVCRDEVRYDLEFDGTRDSVIFTPHHQFQMLAVIFASHAVHQFIEDLISLSPSELADANLKPLNQIIMELNEYLEEGIGLYKAISDQLGHLQTPPVPQVNHFLAFADEQRPEYLVTSRVPYPNPMGYLDIDTRLVERFLDVFFEEGDKKRLAWYMGAAVRNVPVYDPSVSKMLTVVSARSGSGKSTVITALTKALFTTNFSNIMGDFDSHFRRDNRFTSANITNTRMNVYLESDFGIPTKDGETHDFTGLNISTIKDMITDGYMSTEDKYEKRKSSKAFGLHIVISNYVAELNESTEAFRRRILPCVVKPTTMEQKAKQLGLFGQKAFESWVEDHALEFAVYFAKTHLKHAYDYSDYYYNFRALKRELNYVRDKELYDRDPVAAMRRNQDNIYTVLDQFGGLYDFDMDAFYKAVDNAPKGVTQESVRISDGKLYLDGSVNFLSQFTTQPDNLRDVLTELYGPVTKKYSKRRFTITFGVHDRDDYEETKAMITAKETDSDVVVDYTVFDSEKKVDIVLDALETVEVDTVLEKAAHNPLVVDTLPKHNKNRKPSYMKYVKPETLADRSFYEPLDALSEGARTIHLTDNGSFKGVSAHLSPRTRARRDKDNYSQQDIVHAMTDIQRFAHEAAYMEELAKLKIEEQNQ